MLFRSILDLEQGGTCAARKTGLERLRRVGKSKEALEAVQAAGRRMPDNLCMMLDIGGVERAIKERL